MRPTCDLPDTCRTCSKQVEYPSGSLFVTKSRQSRFSSFLRRLCPEKVPPARPLLAISLLFILCISAQALPADRPETGTYIRDMHRDGYGLLVIYNNWTMDTVAVLTDRWDKPRVAVFLRAKDALEVDGIRDGEYSLYFTIGDGWNSSTGDFETVYNHVLFPPMVFETDDTDYTILEVELQEADATNFVPGRFSFPDISS